MSAVPTHLLTPWWCWMNLRPISETQSMKLASVPSALCKSLLSQPPQERSIIHFSISQKSVLRYFSIWNYQTVLERTNPWSWRLSSLNTFQFLENFQLCKLFDKRQVLPSYSFILYTCVGQAKRQTIWGISSRLLSLYQGGKKDLIY